MVERPALEVAGVSKRYGDRDALREVDLVVQAGQLHGLLGPNGAGKTTLMRILLGLIGRDAGSVRLFGTDLNPAAGVPETVAGLVDTPAFYPYLTGRENLMLLARLDGTEKSRRRGMVQHALEQTGLTSHADVAVAGYSAGMRQRLGLAGALLRAPRLLFLDEPTNSLDPAAARDVRALARRLAGEGTAVVLSSHDMAEVEELCTALTIIDRGRVVFCGTVEDLRGRAPAVVHSLHTSDDDTALNLATHWPGLHAAPDSDAGLELSGDLEALDAYVVALGQRGIAVRALERRARSLESLFIALTGQAATEEAISTAAVRTTQKRRASAVM